MKMRQRVNGRSVQMELRREGERVEFRSAAEGEALPERWQEAELCLVEPGIYSVMRGGRVYDVRLEHTHYGTFVQVGATRVLVEAERKAGSAPGAGGGSARVVAEMPGKVVRLLVADGEAVCTGQGLLVLEAMKMQNQIAAPRDGVVRGLSVKEGSTVAAGALLCIVEPSETVEPIESLSSTE